MPDISNNEDIIDSRDIIERIRELEDEHEGAESDARTAGDKWTAPAEEMIELAVLKNLASQCDGYGDWKYGETLIRESHFKEYAQELAEEIGAIDPHAKWPMSCIDWDQAAQELKMDYMEVDYDGVSYLMRA